MKKKSSYLLILTITLAIGLTFFTPAKMQATSLTINDVSSENYTFNSSNQPTPIYSNPETTKATGQSLNTSINLWKAIKEARIGDGVQAYDLGNNQWVKTKDGRSNTEGASYFLEAFTSNEVIPLYSDSLGIHKIGTLDPTNHEWRITRISYLMDTSVVMAVDLGHNQWVLTQGNQDIHLIPKTYYFKAGTSTFDRDGHITGQLFTTTDYQVFGATMTAKYGLSLKLGTETQWVQAALGSLYPLQ